MSGPLAEPASGSKLYLPLGNLAVTEKTRLSRKYIFAEEVVDKLSHVPIN